MRVIFLFLISTLITSCTRYSEGSCEGPHSSCPCNEIYYGLGSLDSINASWLPDSFPTHLIYINKNSQNLQYVLSSQMKENWRHDLRYRKSYCSCNVTGYCYDYCRLEVEYAKYNCNNNTPFNIQIIRQKNATNIDTTNFNTLPDLFNIYIGTFQFPIDLNNYSSGSTQVFYSKLKIGNTSYDSIYEYIRVVNDSSWIVPHGVYYSKSKGIAGFYLTNHIEEWIRN